VEKKPYHKNLVFFAACLGMLLFGISIITLGSAATDLRQKFLLDDISTGTLFSILPVGVLAGSIIFGPICDRIGYKIIFILACLGMFVSFQGIAFSVSFSSLTWFILLFGLSGGVLNGTTNAVVADISTEEKTGNLSLLGVFYGIGALGIPFLLGVLREYFSFENIISSVGWLTIAITLFYLSIKFPASKTEQGFPLANNKLLFKDSVLILIAFFLFCQSSFEGIINNWTTTYLTSQYQVPESRALYALTLFVLGLTIMRLLIGTVLRNIEPSRLLIISLGLLLAGILLIQLVQVYEVVIAGFIIMGAGLSGGFPIMLGLAGNRFKEQSGTAFSFVLVIALIGNMLINYVMGFIAENYGIQHLTTVAFAEVVLMIILGFSIFKILMKNNNKYAGKTMA
jgi:MFS transporter, FHS family, glucose/mannose:H+ symporter